MDVNFNLVVTDKDDIGCSYTPTNGMAIWKLTGYDADKGYAKGVEKPKYLKVRVTVFGDSATKTMEMAQEKLNAGEPVMFRVSGQFEYDLALGEPKMWQGTGENPRVHSSCEVLANRVSIVFAPRPREK